MQTKQSQHTRQDDLRLPGQVMNTLPLQCLANHTADAAVAAAETDGAQPKPTKRKNAQKTI